MSLNRYARKADTSQPAIVQALRDAGVQVWVISKPCDLLARYWCNRRREFVWQPLECKSPYGTKNPKARLDKRQKEQIEFIHETGTPIVLNAEQALRALRIIQ